MLLLLLACAPDPVPEDSLAPEDADADADADADSDSDSDADGDTDTDTDAPPGRIYVAYFVEWGVYDRAFRVSDIPAEVTHVNYAFAQILDGECAVYDSWAALDKDGGNFQQLVDLKATRPELKTLLSIGGWTLSEPFSELAASESGRRAFASSCVDFMLEHGFDGLDIDWEYPVSGGLSPGTAADKDNYTLLLQEVRAQLDLAGEGYLLTIAAPAGPSTIENMDLPDLAEPVDWINLMSYDLHGSWDATTGHNAPLYASDGLSVDAAVQTYLDAGVPAEKLTVGLPFYGRGFSGAEAMGESFSGLPWGTWESGVFDYEDLRDNYVGASGWERRWDAEAGVPWLVNASEQVVISYDDAESIRGKVDYAAERGLRGVMAWELSGEDGDLSAVIGAE
jgi:chitinase